MTIPTGTAKPSMTMSRRRALTITSVVSLFGANAVAVFSNLLFFKPRVTYGEPSRFRIGKAEAYPLGTRLPMTRQRVTIIRTEAGMAAISNTCTHLGCVIATTEIGFDCPCHGSRSTPRAPCSAARRRGRSRGSGSHSRRAASSRSTRPRPCRPERS